MAASVIAAVIARYQTFTINGTATLWFDEVPLRDSAGAVIQPPYVVLKDDGTVPDHEFEHSPTELTKLRFEVYAASLAAADAICAGIRTNGGAIAAGAGMDFASGLTITGQTFKAMVRRGEQRTQEPERGPAAGLMFKVVMRYEVQTLRTA